MSAFWTVLGLAVSAAIVLASVVFLVARYVPAKFVRRHWLFAAAAAAFALWAGVKPEVSWPAGVRDDGSCFDTNDWQFVEFRWKLAQGYPEDANLVIEAALRNDIEARQYFEIWSGAASTLTQRVAAASFAQSHVTNYVFRMSGEYVPGKVEISDFAALACTTQRMVFCTFSCPTNLVGLTGRVEVREKRAGAAWFPVLRATVSEHNGVAVPGNFVNRRTDREFRIVVDGWSPFTLKRRD